MMVFQEPKIEFITIDLSLETTSVSNCTDAAFIAGLTTCDCSDSLHSQQPTTGPGEDYDCDEPGLYKYTGKTISSRDSAKKASPKNVVGFDMTFDK